MSFVASSLLYASFFVRFREPMAICEAKFADFQNTIVRLFFFGNVIANRYICNHICRIQVN